MIVSLMLRRSMPEAAKSHILQENHPKHEELVMAYDEGVAERVREAVQNRPGITERKMFGGIAFMSHGHMFIGVVGETLMARVGPDNYPKALAMPHVREMDFTGKPMKGYIFVEPDGFATDDALAHWVNQCLGFTASLPPKLP